MERNAGTNVSQDRTGARSPGSILAERSEAQQMVRVGSVEPSPSSLTAALEQNQAQAHHEDQMTARRSMAFFESHRSGTSMPGTGLSRRGCADESASGCGSKQNRQSRTCLESTILLAKACLLRLAWSDMKRDQRRALVSADLRTLSQNT